MVDLILRPSGVAEVHNKPWSLQLREHASLGEIEYNTIAQVSDDDAMQIVRAGKPYWLFGTPDWRERMQARLLEKVRRLEEEAAEIRGMF